MPTTSTSTRSRLAFFAGKGGVGKTTLAAAHALTQARAGRRVLLVSTDPAHSLGDVLDQRLAASPRAVRGLPARRVLDAMELDAPRAFARWLQGRRLGLTLALEHGTWLDRADIDALLTLPLPGVDEVAGVLEIVAWSDARRYDLIVVDTAPTGHMLRLVAAPQAMDVVALALDALQQEHRLVRARLARVQRADAADVVIARLAGEAGAAARLLRDGRHASFHWVMLPEALSLAETHDGLRALDQAGVSVACVEVNRVLPSGPACPVCDRRREEEALTIRRAARVFRSRGLRSVFEREAEPRGARALARIRPQAMVADAAPRRTTRAAAYSVAPHHPDGRAALLERLERAELVFVVGKGGVGRTTVAAALALELARRCTRPTLLISTDPAHSLGDVLRRVVGDVPLRMPGAASRLWVRELDASATLASRRAELAAALAELAGSAGAGDDVSQLGRLMDLAPPGLDELVGMLSMLESRDTYGTVVVDMAPTGHALRLLQMPETALAWVQALLRVLLKYRDVVQPGQLAQTLVTWSRSIRALREMLADASRSRAVVVTRAASVPAAEHARLVRQLGRLRLDVAAVVVNARTLATGTCPRCRRRAAAERAVLPSVRRVTRTRALVIDGPLAAPPPRGVRALRAWSGSWTS